MLNRTCSVDGCSGAHEARGYCRVHYRRVRKHGRPDLPQRRFRQCSVAACDAAARARGFCEKHYQRWRKHGDPLKGGGRSLAERLQSRLVPGGPDGTCLVWTGATLKGYGQIGDGPRVLYTHRVAWALENGEIPDGQHVCHRCDNPPCCNERHLFLGDDAANVADMISKGRAPWQTGSAARGERNANAKFTVADVQEVRRLHRLGYSQREIATRVGAPRSRVRGVIDGTSWTWVTEHPAWAEANGWLAPSWGGDAA